MIDDIAYMAVANAELFTNRRCRQFGRLAKISNCAHIIPSESCSWILGSTAINESPFIHHVGRIVSGRPDEEMGRIDTTGAITMMQYPHAIRNGAHGELEGDSMCPFQKSVEFEAAISPVCHLANP